MIELAVTKSCRKCDYYKRKEDESKRNFPAYCTKSQRYITTSLLLYPVWCELSKEQKETKKENYKVWECRIVVPENAEMPRGFDSPPRRAAKNAVYATGIEIVACFSGWGNSVTDTEREVIESFA